MSNTGPSESRVAGGDAVKSLLDEQSIDEWQRQVRQHAQRKGDSLFETPRNHDPVDLISYLVVLGTNWRSRKEAGDAFRIAADLLEDADSLTNPFEIASGDSEVITMAADAPRPVSVTEITDDDAWCADSAWALEALAAGRFCDCSDDYVAIYLKEFQGSGDDPVALQQQFGGELNVPPRRIVTLYVGAED